MGRINRFACFLICCFALMLGITNSASAQGDFGGWSNIQYTVVFVTEVDNASGDTVDVMSTGTNIPSNSAIQSMYGGEVSGGSYSTVGLLLDNDTGMIVGDPIYIQSGSIGIEIRNKSHEGLYYGPAGFDPTVFLPTVDPVEPDTCPTEMPCAGDEKFSGSLSIGKGLVDLAPLRGPATPTAIMAELQLRANRLIGPVSFEVGIREPLYDGYFWKQAFGKFNAGFTCPINQSTELFGTYERNIHTGQEWGWGGFRLNFHG